MQCFILKPRDGEPSIKCLTSEPIRVTDNHFGMPVGKTDQLQPPEHFPQAVYRYTIKEMSLVWYMYGGADFEQKSKSISVSKIVLDT